MFGSGISYVLYVAGSIAVGLYVFRMIHAFLVSKERKDDLIEDRTTELLDRYRSSKRPPQDDHPPVS
jgi:hypothetical protein